MRVRGGGVLTHRRRATDMSEPSSFRSDGKALILGFRVYLEFTFLGQGSRDWGFGFWVSGFRFRVQRCQGPCVRGVSVENLRFQEGLGLRITKGG